MPISQNDINLLKQGQPPEDPELIEKMTIGRDKWLDIITNHYLNIYIRNGGSKVKFLIGAEGFGKTHLLRFVEKEAKRLGYQSVFLKLKDEEKKVLNIVELYKQCAASINRDELAKGLCRRIGNELGYSENEYNGDKPILPLLIEKEGLNRGEAMREIRKTIKNMIRKGDLSPSFNVFVFELLRDRLIGPSGATSQVYWKWFIGEKLDRVEKKNSHLFDILYRASARVWLYSLIQLVRLSGSTGLILLIDELEVMTERNPETNRYRYTPNAVKDICELFRQLIDASELLEYFFVLIAGRPAILSNERRGLKSYEALWMRLQTGLAPIEHFNPYADMVNIEQLIDDIKGVNEFSKRANERLRQIIKDSGLSLKYTDSPSIETQSSLRQRIAETANMISLKGGNDANR